jgi:heme exporter protein B
MPFGAVALVFRRDLRLAFRRPGDWGIPLLFFIAVSAMFPLALSPDRIETGSVETVVASDEAGSEVGGAAGAVDAAGTGISVRPLYGLQSLGIAVLWMAALLSSLMGLDRLFQNDVEDGSMEQLMLSPVPFIALVYGKLAAHWLVSGLPLIVLVPAFGLIYQLPLATSLMLAFALLLATPALTVLVAIGAALTVSLRGAAAIIGLLVLPLASPILIFGARATVLALDAEPAAGPLYFVASLAMLAVSLGPIAIASALRVSLE